MKTFRDLKSVAYIKQIISLAEGLLGLTFRSSGKHKYSTYCPFHKDTTDSFRVHVDEKDEVRFHCFGACDADWDIYDVIRKIQGCSFREAQALLAGYLQEDVKLFAGSSSPEKKTSAPTVERIADEEPSITFSEPVELDKEVGDALERASSFYHGFLADAVDTKFHEYLYKRGVDDTLIERYQIGYAPPYQDEKFTGRALLKEYIGRFDEDHLVFRSFNRAGLFRLLADETTKAYPYYSQFIDHSLWMYGYYGDYFAGRLTFPINSINGRVCGIMGRCPDNRRIKWVKQRTEDTDLNPKSWLYGIDKAYRNIQRYRTVILVEGIFDYFAVLGVFQDPAKPIVVSTLGARITDEALEIFRLLKVKNFIVAYDWDAAGKRAIHSVAKQIGDGCCISYLGGMKEGADPADHLKQAVNSIDGFSLAHLMAGAEKAQALTNKPLHIDYVTTGKPVDRNVRFSPLPSMGESLPPLPQKKPVDYSYSADELLPMLTYNHSNKKLLEDKISALMAVIKTKPVSSDAKRVFTLPYNFVDEERYRLLGPALILWLKIVIEQQLRGRRFKVTDSQLGEQLNTSRATISKYKARLRELGYLKVDTGGKVQKLSVKYFVQ